MASHKNEKFNPPSGATKRLAEGYTSSKHPKKQRSDAQTQYGETIYSEEEDEDVGEEERNEAEDYEEEKEDEEEETGDYGENEVNSVDEEPGANNGSNSITLSDPEVLDCPICFIPLNSPVFQCRNGHIACSSCCTLVVNKCSTCRLKICYRNRAIEKVLDASKVTCKYAKYGCKETMNYNKKHDHVRRCTSMPFYCPVTDCNFIGPSNPLHQHFVNKHMNSAVQFLFDTLFCITLNVDDEFHILREEKSGILFILNNSRSTEHHGNAISVSRVVSTIGLSIPYNISAASMSGLYTLKFESFRSSMFHKWDDIRSSTGFFVVPSYFFNSDGQCKLDVCIFRSLTARSSQHSG